MTTEHNTRNPRPLGLPSVTAPLRAQLIKTLEILSDGDVAVPDLLQAMNPERGNTKPELGTHLGDLAAHWRVLCGGCR